MKKCIKGVLFTVPVTGILTGCVAAAGPPVPPPGPNPLLDKVFLYLQYFLPFLVLVSLSSLIALGFYFFVFKNPSGKYRRPGKDTPEDIAGRRYAGGELSRDEYIRIIRDLRFTDIDDNEFDKYEKLDDMER